MKYSKPHKLIALFFLGALIWSCNPPDEESPNIDIAAPVSVAEVQTGSIAKYTTSTGNAMAEKVIELNTQIAGIYRPQKHPKRKRPFQLGDRVSAGQLFATVEDQEFVNNIGLESAKLNLELAKQEYEKQKSVYDKGGVTLRELRNAELQMTNAQKDLRNAELQVEKPKVLVPVSGVLTELPAHTPDSRIEQGQKLATIMDYSNMFIDVSLPENTMMDIKTGQKVQITNYSLPNDTLVGTISELSPAIDVQTRTYLAKVRFRNPKLLIRPGMFVKTLIKINQKNNIIVIPKEVVISDQKGKRVFVVQENTAFERLIETGLENEELVEVIGGLEENERLVVKGFETLRNKSKVKVLR